VVVHGTPRSAPTWCTPSISRLIHGAVAKTTTPANTAMMPTTRRTGTALPVVPDVGRNRKNFSPIPITP